MFVCVRGVIRARDELYSGRLSRITGSVRTGISWRQPLSLLFVAKADVFLVENLFALVQTRPIEKEYNVIFIIENMEKSSTFWSGSLQ